MEDIIRERAEKYKQYHPAGYAQKLRRMESDAAKRDVVRPSVMGPVDVKERERRAMRSFLARINPVAKEFTKVPEMINRDNKGGGFDVRGLAREFQPTDIAKEFRGQLSDGIQKSVPSHIDAFHTDAPVPSEGSFGLSSPIYFSFKVIPATTALHATVADGDVYLGSVVCDLNSFAAPQDITAQNGERYWYFSINLDGDKTNAVTWSVSDTFPGDGTETVLKWPVVKITGSGGKITEILQFQLGDIHIPRTA